MLQLQWENPSNHRYYRAILQQDLLRDWCVTRVFGRKNTALGRILHTPCGSYSEGLHFLEKLHGQRINRGYKLIDETV